MLLIREVVTGNDGLHTLERSGLGCIDRTDARVRVRRAQHLGPQHAGQRIIRTVLCHAGHFRHAIGTDRRGADELGFFLDVFCLGQHDQAPRSSRAASSTASMILL